MAFLGPEVCDSYDGDVVLMLNDPQPTVPSGWRLSDLTKVEYDDHDDQDMNTNSFRKEQVRKLNLLQEVLYGLKSQSASLSNVHIGVKTINKRFNSNANDDEYDGSTDYLRENAREGRNQQMRDISGRAARHAQTEKRKFSLYDALMDAASRIDGLDQPRHHNGQPFRSWGG